MITDPKTRAGRLRPFMLHRYAQNIGKGVPSGTQHACAKLHTLGIIFNQGADNNPRQIEPDERNGDANAAPEPIHVSKHG